jgi:pyruvate,water dikinase
LYREQISSLYTLGYGLFRDYFLALGNHLASREVIGNQDDVFYLYFDEVVRIVKSSSEDPEYTRLINHRRNEMDSCKDLIIPSIIYGDQPPSIDKRKQEKLSGTPTSNGYYKGSAKVIRSMDDFDKLNQGDVLVIPYSDVGWAPLFTKAGAVIAESGGILSHSSIIAREYGIPAVVSVSGACQIENNTVVAVDGYAGEITLFNEGTA